MGLVAWIKRKVVIREMTKIVNWLVNLLSAGPLKGYRTKILSLILFVLGGLRLSGRLAFIDDQTYNSVVAILAGAIGATAAVHKA